MLFQSSTRFIYLFSRLISIDTLSGSLLTCIMPSLRDLFLIYVNGLISPAKNTWPLESCKLFHPDASTCSNATFNEDFIVAFADNTILGPLERRNVISGLNLWPYSRE